MVYHIIVLLLKEHIVALQITRFVVPTKNVSAEVVNVLVVLELIPVHSA